MANKQHLKYYYQTKRRVAIVLAVQVLGRFTYEITPDVLVDHSQQIVFRHPLLSLHHFQFYLRGMSRL